MDVALRKPCGKLPQIVLTVAAQQRIQLIFEVGHGQGVRRGILVLDDQGLQPFNFRLLRGSQLAPPKFVRRVANFCKISRNWLEARFAAEAGLLRFVSESCGKFSQRRQAVALLLHARGFAHLIGSSCPPGVGQVRASFAPGHGIGIPENAECSNRSARVCQEQQIFHS